MRQTEWRQVEGVLAPLFDLYPTSLAMAQAHTEHIAELIRSTGLYNRKAEDLIEFSRQTVDGVPFDQRRGIGPYARDAHALLVRGEIDREGVEDYALRRWQEWAKKSCEQAVSDAIRLDSAR